MDLVGLVDRFLRDRPSCFAGGCDYDFVLPPANSIDDAIKVACRSQDINGKLHSHQYRVRKDARKRLEQALLGDADRVEVVTSFDDLHALVVNHCKAVSGAGALYAYDVALRIAQVFLGVEPEYVYLHAGAAEGARYLGVRGLKHKLDAFPEAMHKLTPAQAEDFLCICKGRLAEYKSVSH